MDGAHEVAQGLVDEAVLVDEPEVLERGRRHAHLEVVTRAGRIHDLDASTCEGLLYAAAHRLGAHHPPLGTRGGELAQALGNLRAAAQMQLRGGLAVLSQVQVLVPDGLVAVITIEVDVPLHTENTTPADALKPGRVRQLLE